ncbi:hypothetical protein BH09BAC3_BH09BAC3_19970 [soil metagenome]
MKKSFKFLSIAIIGSLLLLTGCKKDDPKPEDVPELITKATITFTPSGGGALIIVTATDPDNNGPQDIKVDGPIDLLKGTSYSLSIRLINGLYQSTDPSYDVTTEVEEQGVEHQFFFSWTNGIFSSPTGDGNIDNRNDPVNYGTSLDANGRPLGLTTSWTASPDVSSGSNAFRIVLKHQPDIKSNTSTSNDGETDLDLTFVINVK